MSPEDGYVVLELKVPENQVTGIDTAKWTKITNYSYIALDEKDEKEHQRLLSEAGTDNIRAVMTSFYPEIRKKIIGSWDRLFDRTITLGSTSEYGLMWEVKKEWIQKTVI
jgi:23S rRNA U2552 (ribose-2'-O)-methylase RlmE/FtsJ